MVWIFFYSMYVYSQWHFSTLIEDYNKQNVQLNTLYVAFLDLVNLGGGYTKMQKKKSKQDIIIDIIEDWVVYSKVE